MTDRAASTDSRSLHGRNRVSARALRAVVSAVAAAELKTGAKTVTVDLADDSGSLSLAISAPIGIAPLRSKGLASSAPPAQTPSVIERATAAQNTIRSRVLELTGSTVGTVDLRLTAARIEEEERVR